MPSQRPFPERMIEADPDHFFEACLVGWGGATQQAFAQIEAYRAAWRDPATIAGMTNDYRAAGQRGPGTGFSEQRASA